MVGDCEDDIVDDYLRGQQRVTVLSRAYELLTGFMQFGEGDLLLDRGDKLTAVECKHLGQNTGKTARVRRTKKRAHVREQALLHAAFVKVRNPHRHVEAVAVTNEGEELVHSNMSTQEALRRVMDRLQHVDYGFLPTKATSAMRELFGHFITK